MPQWKIFYGSIILISATMLLLLTRTILCSPIGSGSVASSSAEEGLGSDGSGGDQKHSLNKRSFYDINCKGIYDKTIFARVNQICEDCYNLFRAPKLHTLCRQNCFTGEYFQGCVEVLLLTDELPKIQQWIRRLNGLGV